MIPYLVYEQKAPPSAKDSGKVAAISVSGSGIIDDPRESPVPRWMVLLTRVVCSLWCCIHGAAVLIPLISFYPAIRQYSVGIAVAGVVLSAVSISCDIFLLLKVVMINGYRNSLVVPFAILSALLSSAWLAIYWFLREETFFCGNGYTDYTCTGTWTDSSALLHLVCAVPSSAAQSTFLQSSVAQPNSVYNCWGTPALSVNSFVSVGASARLCSGAWSNIGPSLCYCSDGSRTCSDPLNLPYLLAQLGADIFHGHAALVWRFSNTAVWAVPLLVNDMLKPVANLPDFWPIVVYPFLGELTVIVLFSVLYFAYPPTDSIVPLYGSISVAAGMCILSVAKIVQLTNAFVQFNEEKWTEMQLFVDYIKERYSSLWETLVTLLNQCIAVSFGILSLYSLHWKINTSNYVTSALSIVLILVGITTALLMPLRYEFISGRFRKAMRKRRAVKNKKAMSVEWAQMVAKKVPPPPTGGGNQIAPETTAPNKAADNDSNAPAVESKNPQTSSSRPASSQPRTPGPPDQALLSIKKIAARKSMAPPTPQRSVRGDLSTSSPLSL